MIKDVDTTRYVTMGKADVLLAMGSGDHEKIIANWDAVSLTIL